MLGLCPISGRPIAGEVAGPRGEHYAWLLGQADQWAALAAIAAQVDAARAASIAAAQAAEETEEDGEPQGEPEDETTPGDRRRRARLFAFCGCCCSYQKDPFAGQDILPAVWDAGDDWEIVDGKLQTEAADARIDCLVTHPDAKNRYRVSAKVACTEPGDVAQIFANDNAIRGEVRFAETGRVGQVLLFVNDLCQGAYSPLSGFVAGDEVVLGLCCADDVAALTIGGAETLSAEVEITSSKVALGTGALTGTATFDDFRLDLAKEDLSKCDDCVPVCTVVDHRLLAADAADVLPALVVSGGTMDGAQANLDAGGSIAIEEVEVGYGGGFRLSATIAASQAGTISWSINDGEIVATAVLATTAFDARLRLAVRGHPTLEVKGGLLAPTTEAFFRVCCGGGKVYAAIGERAIGRDYQTRYSAATLANVSGGTLIVRRVTLGRVQEDLATCDPCHEDVMEPCAACSENPDVPQYLLVTIPEEHFNAIDGSGTPQSQCDAIAGSYVLELTTGGPFGCMWSGAFDPGVCSAGFDLSVWIQRNFATDEWEWRCDFYWRDQSSENATMYWRGPAEVDEDDKPICNIGQVSLEYDTPDPPMICCDWDGEPLTIEALL